MLLFKKKKVDTQFIGPEYEKEYKKLINKDKIKALPYLRRAALLLYPLKPELWDNYIKLRNEILIPGKPKKEKILFDLKNEMEDL